MGKKKNQCTRIGLLKPSTTLKWAQWFWSEEALLPAHSLMLPHKSSSRHAPVPLALSRGLGSWPREALSPEGMGTVSIGPEWGLVRKRSGSVRSWSPHGNVWQVALRKNTESGSSTWQLCIGRDSSELELNCLPHAWPKQWWGWPVHAVWVVDLKRRECFLLIVSFVLGLLKLDSR